MTIHNATPTWVITMKCFQCNSRGFQPHTVFSPGMSMSFVDYRFLCNLCRSEVLCEGSTVTSSRCHIAPDQDLHWSREDCQLSGAGVETLRSQWLVTSHQSFGWPVLSHDIVLREALVQTTVLLWLISFILFYILFYYLFIILFYLFIADEFSLWTSTFISFI